MSEPADKVREYLAADMSPELAEKLLVSILILVDLSGKTCEL